MAGGRDRARDMTRLEPLVCFFSFLLDYTDSKLYLDLPLRLWVLPSSRNHEKGPKRRETRHLGPRWVFFIYIRVFYYILMIYTGTIYVIQARTTITGPNDAIRIVWAQGKYFLVFFVFLQIYLLFSIDSLIDFKTKGPNTTPHHTTPHRHHLDESHHLPPKPRQIATSPHHLKDRSRGKGSRRDTSRALGTFFFPFFKN